MNLIRGENISISMNGEILSCWRSSTLQIQTDLIGKSTIGSGNWKEFEAVVNSWTVSGEGQIWQSVTFSIHDATALQVALTVVTVLFLLIEKDESGNVIGAVYYAGDAIITSTQQTGNVNDLASFNISLQGTGELQIITNGVYGNYPDDFQVINALSDNPDPGLTLLSFVWNAADPEADDYTIKILNNTTSATHFITGGMPGHTIDYDVYSDNNYTFSIASNYFGGALQSSYSPTIIWPSPHVDGSNYIRDADGPLIIDTDNQALKTV
jgi:hypothetical protein